MCCKVRCLALLGLFGVFALAYNTTITANESLPATTGSKVVAEDIKFLQKGLAAKPTRSGQINALKSAAMLIALNAQMQMTGPDADKMTATRDQALKVAELLANKKVADAIKAANGFADAKPGDKKALKLAEMHKFSLDEVMGLFRSARTGGMNIESDFKTAEKAMESLSDTELQAARISLIGEYALLMPPSDAVGAKKTKWEELSKEMINLGAEAAEEAAKGANADKEKLTKLINGLNANCTACHEVFR